MKVCDLNSQNINKAIGIKLTQGICPRQLIYRQKNWDTIDLDFAYKATLEAVFQPNMCACFQLLMPPF